MSAQIQIWKYPIYLNQIIPPSSHKFFITARKFAFDFMQLEISFSKAFSEIEEKMFSGIAS